MNLCPNGKGQSAKDWAEMEGASMWIVFTLRVDTHQQKDFKLHLNRVIVTNCVPTIFQFEHTHTHTYDIKLILSLPKRLISLLLCTLLKCECHGFVENTKQTNWAHTKHKRIDRIYTVFMILQQKTSNNSSSSKTLLVLLHSTFEERKKKCLNGIAF